MDRRFARPLRVAAAFVLALLMLTLGAGPARIAQAQTQVIRIGTMRIDGGAEVVFAREMGFFKQAGLDVDVSTFTSGSAIAAAVVSGSLDIGFSNVLSLATAYKHHVPVKIVAPAGLYVSSAPVAVCMVPLGSPIKSAKELDGKTFGTNALKNIGEYAPRQWIDENGGNSASVKFVELAVPAMAEAFAQNRIDAGIVVEPYVAQARKVARVLSNCYDAVASNFVISAYFTSDAWAQAHPEQAKAFQGVMRQTAIWARKNRAASAKILTKVDGIDAATLANSVRADFGDSLDAAAIQPTIDLAARYGAIDATFPAADLLYHPPAP